MKNLDLQKNPLFSSFMVAMIIWAAWVYFGGSRAFSSVIENWEITLTMVFGSIIAGMTSEGGGAVAFPIFTKVLHIAPADARIFSLAIQSIGMTAASLTIVFMKIPVQWKAIITAGLAGALGLLASTFFIVPIASPPAVKVAFTVMVTTLAIALLFMNMNRKVLYNNSIPVFGVREIAILAAAGAIGGAMSGLVGSGIDIITFMVLVLLFKLNEKIATPTTVVLMTTNTLVGFALHALVLDTFTTTIQSYWLAAIPVVCVGAPFGAYLCTLMRRKHIAFFLIGLIFVELVSTILLVPMSPFLVKVAAASLIFCGSLNWFMYSTKRYTTDKSSRDEITSNNKKLKAA